MKRKITSHQIVINDPRVEIRGGRRRRRRRKGRNFAILPRLNLIK